MGIEIERKFLVTSDDWRADAGPGDRYCQGFLAKGRLGSVRVRRAGCCATVTVKGRRQGITRSEYEYAIPVHDAEEMLRELCAKPLIEKVRHDVEHAGVTWEVDVYCGDATGLVLAEVELDRADQSLVAPEWVGEEVTHDLRYSSEAIAHGEWRSDERLRLSVPSGL